MHALIVGCGRTGAELSDSFGERGFTVSIIDKDPKRFEQRLHKGSRAQTFTGLAFDRVVLEAAGIKNAEVFIAATNGDNSNIVAARIAKEHYGVPKVAALIYDPRRAQIYERLGIPTVATVAWTTDQLLSRVLPAADSLEGTIGSGEVVVTGVRTPPGLIAKPAASLNVPGKLQLAAITRFGETSVPDGRTLLQEGDFLHLVVVRSALDDVENMIGESGEERSR